MKYFLSILGVYEKIDKMNKKYIVASKVKIKHGRNNSIWCIFRGNGIPYS